MLQYQTSQNVRASSSLRHLLECEAGSAAVFVALTMVALMSAAALAVDVGMLFTGRSEAQRAADAAALAGAGSLIAQPFDEARARQVAIDYGALNTVRDSAVEVLPEDVDVDLVNARVTVRVRRTADRGSAVATWFARVFGVNEVDIATTATAQASPTGSATCVKPLAIPDRFIDFDGDGEFDQGQDIYDPATTGYGSDYRNPGRPGDDGLGYINDYGRPVELKQGGPDKFQPGWYYPWDVPQTDGAPDVGADRYRWNLENCNPAVVSVGDEFMIEPGAMDGPTRQGVDNLSGSDPYATWDSYAGSVEGSRFATNWEGSPRIGIIPTFDPSRPFEPGNQPIKFTNFIAVFFDDVVGGGPNQQVHGWLLYPFGVAGGDPNARTMARFVQLIR